MNRRSRACKIVYLIDLYIERERDIVPMQLEPGMAVLTKPFPLEALLAAVRRTLAPASAGARNLAVTSRGGYFAPER